MNIKEAKNSIKDCVRLYLKKDKEGNYRIPIEKQRPIFLLGAPGIGKTAIMEQIARELNIGLVSYSMTHHTRQSALGLPVICHEEYEDKKYDVSRYTMSEIIAAIYDEMKRTGKKQGILFLDEINCVSETLSPAMLLFLQYKIFGSYKVPEGWVIVSAGNPPEYNRQVKDFDVVTLDRMRVMKLDPDFNAFREYAVTKGLHGSILSFLDMNEEYFYTIENTVEGKKYVTARGWEDLSLIIKLSEEENIDITENLVKEYICHEKIAESYFSYYKLYTRYKVSLPIGEIINGNVTDEDIVRMQGASYDEIIILIYLLCENLDRLFEEINKESQMLIEDKNLASTMLEPLKEKVATAGKRLDNVLGFMRDTYGEEREMVMLLTRLSLSGESSEYLARFGNAGYDKYSSALLVSDKADSIRKEIKEI